MQARAGAGGAAAPSEQRHLPGGVRPAKAAAIELASRRLPALLAIQAVTPAGDLETLGDQVGEVVITSYSIHYTKLYEDPAGQMALF